MMKITLDIPDGIIAGFFNGVEVTAHGMQLVSYQLSTDDLKDGNTVKNTPSDVCLSSLAAETASTTRVARTVQSLTIATEWRISMSKKCVCGKEMFTVFICRKCEHLLYVEEDEDFPQKLGKIAAKSCPCCGEQEEGLWRLLGRAEGFEGTVFTEESDED